MDISGETTGEIKPQWIETPSHLGGGWTACTVPSSFVALIPMGPEYTARLMLPSGGHRDIIITDYEDTQDAMDKAWAWALEQLDTNQT